MSAGLYVLCIAAFLLLIQQRFRGYVCVHCGTRDGNHDDSCPWSRQ